MLEAAAHGADAKTKRWGKARPYYGRVLAIDGLCTIRTADDKDTIRVELDLGDSGLTYQPGDALGIYPCNSPKVTEESSWSSPHHNLPRFRLTLLCLYMHPCRP